MISKLALVQFAPGLGLKEKNVEKINDYIDNIQADIIVFPELATSGYFFQSRDEVLQLADSADGELIKSFQAKSTPSGKTLIIGFPEIVKCPENHFRLYNSVAAIFPDPEMFYIYRKSHLFYKEKFAFDPGDTGFNVIEDKSRDLKIGLMICYDWRFPEASRTLALQGADIIICPSNLVTDVWHKVMPARAIENKVYFAVANRCGTEERNKEILTFKGESAIYSYNGKELVKAGIDNEIVIMSEIEPEKTRNKSFNEINDVFKDRRPELYI